MNKPDITLYVIAYNRPKDLENTIKSYLFQTYKKSEMVIVDDKSPIDLTPIVKKWIKKDKRIRFYRNKKNLGLAKNFSESFKYCKGKYIVTLGDDDLFIDKEALKKYVDVFESDKETGVIRSRQVIIRNNRLYQVSAIGDKEIEVYNKGKESLDKFVMDTISMAGNAFRNDSILKLANSYSESTYLQVELSAKIALFRKSAVINKYLIGVGSGENQLNVLTYKLNGYETNILNDFDLIIDRINQFVKKQKIKIKIDKNKFLQRIVDSIIILLPYDSLKNGKSSSLKFALKMRTNLTKFPLFMIAIVMALMPSLITKMLLKIINKVKLKLSLPPIEINRINDNIEKILLIK